MANGAVCCRTTHSRCATRIPAKDPGALVNIGKAYSGVTDAEIAQLTKFFLEHTVEDHGHVRDVEPVIVMEIAFNNIQKSNRHNSGFAFAISRASFDCATTSPSAISTRCHAYVKFSPARLPSSDAA